MGTPLGPKYIPYTYMDPLGLLTLCLNSSLSFVGLKGPVAELGFRVDGVVEVVYEP